MKKFSPYLADVLLRSTLLISEEEIENLTLNESNLEILEQKLYDKLQSGEWKEDIRFKHDFNAFNDYAGAYSSINDFIDLNDLKMVADEVWGKDWEADDDTSRVADLLTALGVSDEYLVSVIEDERVDKDILVTSLKHLSIYKNTYKDYYVYDINDKVCGRIFNVKGIEDEKFKLQLFHLDSGVDIYVDAIPPITYKSHHSLSDGYTLVTLSINGTEKEFQIKECP